MMRRSAVKQAGELRTDITSAEDWEYITRLSRVGHIAFIDAPEPVLAFTRTSPGQRLLVAFNLSADAVQWALPDGLEPHAINDKGLLAGRVDRGQLHLPARGVFFARLD